MSASDSPGPHRRGTSSEGRPIGGPPTAGPQHPVGTVGWMHFPAVRLLATEFRIQSRSGLYAAYALVSAFFVALLLLAPEAWRSRVFELIVLLDPSFAGFFFAGALVLLERDQGVLPLVVTRGRGFRAWWQAKALAVLSLAFTVVALLVVISATLGLLRFSASGLALLAAGLTLTVPVFLSLGVAMAARFPRVIDYFLYSGIILTPVMFPLVELVGVPVGPVGAVSPVWGAHVLITSLFEPLRSTPEIIAAVASLLVWNVIAYRLASRGFEALAGAGAGTAAAPDARPAVRNDARRRHGNYPDPATGARRSTRRRSAVRADIHLILREPATCAILLAPLLIAPLFGRLLPWAFDSAGPLSGLLSAQIFAALREHLDYARSFAVVLSAALYGMLGGLLILDEKDIGMVPVLRTLPGPPQWYLVRRCERLVLLFALAMVVGVLLGGLQHGPPGVFVLSLLVDALTVPIIFFTMGVIAKSKVQGLAIGKLINIATVAPLFIALLPGRWAWAVGVLPTAWGTLMRTTAAGAWESALAGLGGVLYGGLAGLLLLRRMRRGGTQ